MEGDCTRNPEDWNNKSIRESLSGMMGCHGNH